MNAPYLAQGQCFEVFRPERRGVCTKKPVVGSQVGGADVPRVGGPEEIGQIVGGVLIGEISYRNKKNGQVTTKWKQEQRLYRIIKRQYTVCLAIADIGANYVRSAPRLTYHVDGGQLIGRVGTG